MFRRFHSPGSETGTVDRQHLVATLGGFLFAGGVFAAMFWLVDAEAVLAVARQANPWLLGVVAATILLWNVAWGVELWTVLGALDVEAGLHTALLVNAAGAFANHVTPFGQAGGEPVTAWLLTQTTDADYEIGLASIASLDAINVLPSLSFATVGLGYYLTQTSVTVSFDAATVALSGLALVAVGVLAWRFRGLVSRLAGKTAFRLARAVGALLPRVTPPSKDAIADRAAAFVGAIRRVATDRPRLLTSVGLSALGWGFQAVGLWVTFLALDAHIPVYVPFFVLPLGTLGSVLPTPGGLGGTEAINVSVLTVVTAVAPATIAAAVTLHSVGGYLLTTSVGAVATSVLGVRGAVRE